MTILVIRLVGRIPLASAKSGSAKPYFRNAVKESPKWQVEQRGYNQQCRPPVVVKQSQNFTRPGFRRFARRYEQLHCCVDNEARNQQYADASRQSQQRVQPPGYSPQPVRGKHYALTLARPEGINADTRKPRKYSPAAR